MGQAKQRGTAEQRVDQANAKTEAQAEAEGLHPISVDQLREDNNVPADAKFVGFVVWLRERDEFLVHLEETVASTARAYGKFVDAAVLFSTWHDAFSHAKASKHPAIVAVAFDVGNQIMVIGG